ncbi:T9SS type B sorting domain-containing protein, partial [Flavobacteriaceae bacterium]|nr:T9SS type B sorting domain-containing protein [Flavobacteriaceae bacterium]
MKNKIITLLFILFSSLAFSQLSKVHYIPPITSGPSNANPEDQYLYISTPNKGDVNVTINIMGSGSESQVVSNDNPWIYTISQDGYSSLVQNPETTSIVTNNTGFIIESDSPIYVSARLNAGGAQAGALVSKGENALGTTFRIGTYDNQGSVSSNYMNFFSFMATEDNTIVNLSNNLTNGFDFENSSEQFPFNNIILNRGESYVLAARADKASANRAGLIGTLISSSKPIVVNTGSANGSFGTGGARDYGIDQIVDLSKVGKEYIFVKGNGENSYENVLIVVHEDNTEIFVNGDSKATRNSGEYYIVEGDQFINDNMYVNTSNDTFVYQGIGGTNSEANQGMFFVPPLSCGSRGDVDNIPYIDKIGNLTFTGGITIVTKENSEVIINGDEISSQPGGVNVTGPTSVTAKNSYVTYKVTGLTGNVSVSSSDELYVSYFNLNGAAASGSFFSGFASNPSLDLNLSATKLGSCISEAGTSNIELNVSNNGNFDSVQWEKKNADNTWSSITGQTNSQFTPTQIGTYRVKGIIACDGETVEYYSSEIPISQCPDDFDGDGIINNLDLDQDNDGILNSVESRGIGNIDFSNTASPTINLSDGTAINGAISGLVNGDGSLSGQNQSFEMQVEAGVDQELKYALTFTENLNINVKDNQNVSVAIRNGESFIIKSSPASSNITLLDPSNNLLVDTNFDDEFENNVTEFTSNEIRFKFNTNSTATIDYELFATKIDGVTFTHKYSTTETGESVFVPNVYVYDYKNDSDGDGNEDMFEIDSDNDGCNDIIEADFTALENYQGDLDNDGIYGDGTQTFDNGLVNSRGLIKVHNDADGYNTDPKKDSNGNYLFQIAGNPVQIIDEPISTDGCEGSTVEFEINATSSGEGISYQWQFFNLENSNWDNLSDSGSYSGTSSSKLIISSISTSMDGRYRVALKSETYLCESYSNGNVNLSVNAAPDNPIVSQIQTFCQSDSSKISDLNTNNLGANTLYWYDSIDSTTPLDSSTLLEHNSFYYAEYVDEKGCVSSGRTESKAFISNPILTSTFEELCIGETASLTIENIAKTASDFASDNDLVFIKNNGEPVSWPTEYGQTYFLIQANTNKVGFEPIDWPDAKELTDSYNSGDSNASARMYVILNADMENAVWNGLNSMGLTGSNGVAFWLGLYQDLNDPEYQEPGNEAQNYAGWKWVNGQKLSDTGYTNWFTAEPNNAGDTEHHGQFEFGNFGIKWNDMSVGSQNGKSWPLFEYTGSTDIVWGYYDKDGNEIEFTEQPGTGSLDVSPTETTTYYVKVSVNNVICYAEKTVIVNPNPISNTIQDYVFCDDDLDGDANNGSIVLEESNFEVLKPSILGDNQSVNDFTVSFHLSEDDAQTNNPIIFPFTTPEKDASKSHWESQITEVFVRIVNNTTGCVNVGSSFNLVVNTLPITFEVDDIILCDDNRDGIVDGFDLSSRTNELRSGNESTDPDDTDNQSPDNFPVTYHLSIDDANDLNNNGLVSPYKSGNETIFYRIEKRSNEGDLICIKTGEAFNIVVENLPFANEVTILRQCDGDDPLDTNSEDGKFPFDVSEIQNKLLDGQNAVTTYYFDENDVFIGNILPDIFETTSQTITITVENNSDLKCSDSTTLEFIVDDSPEFYEVIIPSNCDDGVSDIDGYSEFDTSSITETLLTNPLNNQMQSLDNYSVSYTFIDENGDSQTSSNLPNPFNTKTQAVSVTVTNKINNSCIISENIEFIVTPLPVINENLIKIEQCDDGKGSENDGITLHNLTESQSLFSTNFTNETFEYYLDENLTQKIDNPTSFYNDPLYDEVWVKIISENGCERISKTQNGNERLKIEITVGASEISETFIEDNNTLYSVCEDSDALNQDGLSVFSSSVLKEINDKLIASKAIFQDQNIKVTLHRNSIDGLTGENPISLNEDFTNSTPNVQEIWARIVNIDITKFTCLGFAKVGELYVEPKPIANPVTIEKQCDGDNPLDLDSQDGVYPFDVSLIEEQVLMGQTDATVTYFNEDGTQIQNFGPVFETASQTITIKVEREADNLNILNPDGLCYDITTLKFVVNDSPEAYPVVIAPHCDGDDGLSDVDGYDIFDTSEVIDLLTTNPISGISQDLTKLNIEFTYLDELGSIQTDSKLPNPFNTKTQTVSVTIENPLNLNCIINEEIDFIVNPLPSFDIDDEIIVCLNPIPDNPLEIGTYNWNGANDPSIYNYSWSRVDLNGVDDTAYNETTETIKVDKGGVYTVIVEDAISFCTRSKSITVTESEMAKISLDDITVDDLKNDNTNTITIDTLNLGIGDYEFSLDEAFGPYQDEPVFESIKPGIHTIYIRDKNSYYTYDYGCGIAQIDVSVIGYRKYFTPNGDGINETWKILGIRSDFNAGSKVYIFDRFGKLLKELDPLTNGWDGTYLGKPMPATDYWFRTYLEDGREFKGHFSL